MARKKKLSKREQCIQDISEVENDIKIRIEHFDYVYGTMHHFREPRYRVRGVDTVQYENDFIGLTIREQELKKRFNEKYRSKENNDQARS